MIDRAEEDTIKRCEDCKENEKLIGGKIRLCWHPKRQYDFCINERAHGQCGIKAKLFR